MKTTSNMTWCEKCLSVTYHATDNGECFKCFTDAIDNLVKRIGEARNTEELDAIYINGMAQFGKQVDAIADTIIAGGMSGEQVPLTDDLFRFD